MKEILIVNEDYVSAETFELLKEKGFKSQHIRTGLNNGYEKPTLSLAIKWLFVNYGLDVEVLYFKNRYRGTIPKIPSAWDYSINKYSEGDLTLARDYSEGDAIRCYDSREAAFEAGIIYSLVNIISQ